MRPRQSFFIITVSISILAGAINVISSKFQNQQYVNEGGYTKFFYHPFMDTYIVFISVSLALPLYYLHKWLKPQLYALKRQRAVQQGKIMKFNKLRILVCTFSDVIGNTLQSFALNFISASVYQITRGGSIASTFLFSVFFLKTKETRHQIIGSVLTVLGITIVGISDIIYLEDNNSYYQNLEIIGYFTVVISVIFDGLTYTYEEHLLKNYHIQPIELAGYEGVFGVCVNSILMFIFTFSPCSFGYMACVLIDQKPYIERPDVYFQQLADNEYLLIAFLIQVFTFLLFNICGLSITQHIDSLGRAVCDVSKTAIIWLVGIMLTVTIGTSKQNYKWESVQGGAIGMQLSGLILLIIGNLVYGQILKLPKFIKSQTNTNYLVFDNKDDSIQQF